ncbi:tumor necrosis factor receptor superfamily member 9 isoform X2 [Coregonus clupeaformis]|uniref:tumor necrosis factor receptor superfamily member 9 isoform X2 n=1 Tax=Coregonus clupeaformis TaxID=59861 RepID=UPI001E1C6E6A|nr:tumor necrosis factor receptor superfamily member 9 isoform X2 [Coregonus clupeaformis]
MLLVFAIILGNSRQTVRKMHLVLSVLCLSMLTLSCLSNTGEIEIGCGQWTTSAGSTDVCCERCNPGNRLVTRCGPDPKKLCVPCGNETYTTDSSSHSCHRCTQCVGGAQFLKKACTKSKDTECDCMAGFRCGDDHCTFCVEECGKGQEPLPAARSCRNCPDGTFNDQIHEKCKSWRISCPHPNEHIVTLGDAVSNSKCGIANIVTPEVNTLPTTLPDHEGLVWAVSTSFGVFIILIILFLVIITKKKQEKTAPKEPTLIVLTPPTDEPRSLIEISFHNPQQEQGSSSEILCSQDSETKLLPV